MKNFLSNIVSSFIGVFLASIAIGFLSITLLIGFIVTIAEEFEDQGALKSINEPSVLILRLGYPIQEKTSEDPFDHYDFNTMESRVVLGLDDIVENIQSAQTDPNIKGIYLNLFPEHHGWATSEAIRNALKRFKKSGKWILAYNEIHNHQSYYIASVADQIFLNPEGFMEFQGLNAQSLFLKNTLEKLDIEIQVLRGPENEYKSAIETFVNTEMSEKSRYQTQILVDEIWSHTLDQIAIERNIEANTLNILADTLAIKQAEDAVNANLVDDLLYLDEVRALIRNKMNITAPKKIPAVSIEDYAMYKKSEREIKSFTDKSPNEIAVIYADGDIMSGENDKGIVGSRTTAQAIRYARESENIKAIVLRVNSPGGSALASDVILREIFLSSQNKPTLVSFGDVAASGGYYISAAANKIYAEPNTITGSIGVFSIIPNLEKFFQNKLGVSFDNVNSNKYAGFGNLSRPLKPYEKAVLEEQVEAVYTSFKEHVARGRGFNEQELEAAAKGRVWSGIAAKEMGLVDELGGLHAAINDAAQQAQVQNYRLIKLPMEDTPFSRFLKGANENAKSWLALQVFGEELSPLIEQREQLERLSKSKGVQARLPFEILIR